jgi:hypothetical protein
VSMRRSRSSSRGANVSVTMYWRGENAATAFSLWTWVQAAFLPEGYPYSCSDDYMEYQLYDTLQALCSTLVGHMGKK